MSDKFSIDDILAEIGSDNDVSKKTAKSSGVADKKAPSQSKPGATMILNSIDEKKKTQGKENTIEISAENLQHLKGVVGEGQRRPKEPAHQTQKTAESPKVKKPDSDVHYKSLSEFEDDEKPKEKAEKVSVSINTSANMTFRQKVKQYRFLFEELTKRDFKKKYKRTLLGVLWSIISPFLTFLVQYFVFGYIFHRLDSGFVIYLLTGTLMFNFFTNATTNGMFSMYSNGAILSKVKVPKSLFVLSSNSAAIFNFLLTLIVYFAFMIFCKITFGLHLLLIIYPILCLIIFNIGMSYILSALFVFFRDMQYLYQIFTMLLMYMSAIFYEVKHFPEELRFIFNVNPVYHYISYMRQLVMQASVPSLTEHIICLSFALGMLGIGYFIHSKTEQKFVYYY